MNDTDIDRAVALVDPLDTWPAGFLAGGAGAVQLREAIIGSAPAAAERHGGEGVPLRAALPADRPPALPADRPPALPADRHPARVGGRHPAKVGGRASGRPRRRLRLPLLVAAAVVAVLAVSGVAVLRPGSAGGPSSAWAADVLAVAQNAPRFLVTADGWAVTRADEFSAVDGEMTFSNGSRSLDLHWRPGSFADWVSDRAASSGPPSTVTIAGAAATLFQYTGSTDFTALWLVGANTMELRGEFPSRADYLAVADTLKPVDVDTWLNAMPASVVRPDQRKDAIAGMLNGIPLPAGFDVDALAQRATVSDRYQLGAAVSGAVACDWIAQWVTATADGDAAAARAAATAMAGSHGWAILNEMNPDGDYPEVVWEYADAMNGVAGVDPNGQAWKVDVASSYRQALGCR